MAEPTEPRALSAALASPAFVTRNGGLMMHAANRHVERWAPEAGADKVRTLRNLGFVDRLIAPWMETAQRSATLRMFSQAQQGQRSEREVNSPSWVFPRPWYQDELDWMAAARDVPAAAAQGSGQSIAPTMLTTRGTYVAPQQAVNTFNRTASTTIMPAALYEYVAPSLSIAKPGASVASQVQGIGFGGSTGARADAYSPLIPLAAVQAAQMMARIAPSVAATTKTPMLRDVLSTILQRATITGDRPSLAIAERAPELVTPPAPRGPDEVTATAAPDQPTIETPAMQLATRMVEQRAQIVELQRAAQQAATREIIARQAVAAAQISAVAPTSQPASSDAAREASRVAVARIEQARTEAARSEVARTEAATSEITRAEVARNDASRTEAARAEIQRTETARIEERVAQWLAERQATSTQATRLHEQARSEAAQHARAAATTPSPLAIEPTAVASTTPPAITAALAALPPELAAYLSARPTSAVRAISELDTAMHAVELLARSASSNQAFEVTRGPRMMLPAGIGGLVASMSQASTLGPAARVATPATTTAASAAPRRELRVPTLSFADPATPAQQTRATATFRGPMLTPSIGDLRGTSSAMNPALVTGSYVAPTSAFAATTSSAPVALAHVAWADRWLARFAGATPRSLDTYAAATTGGMQALVDAAPSAVFVAPTFDIEREPAAAIAAASANSAASSASLGGATAATQARGQIASPVAATPAAARPAPTLIPSAPTVVRYDDDAETPDDVFAAISATASQRRVTAAITPAQAAAAQAAAVAAQAAAATPPSANFADVIAHSAPIAPHAGMAAQLSASPFAPALRHVLPLAAANTFDVRALFGAGLSTSYLAGLLAPSSHEVQSAVISPANAPAWARWTELASTLGAVGSTLGGATESERAPRDFDPTYVVPELPAIAAGATAEQIEIAQAQIAQHQVQQQAAQHAAEKAAIVADVAAQLVTSQATSPAEIATIAARVGIAPTELAAAVARVGSPAAAATAQSIAQQQLAQLAATPTTTLRTALLSWDSEVQQPTVIAGVQQPAAATGGTFAPAAQSMIDTLAMPMLGETGETPDGVSWTGPGMVAERARTWSVAQERSAADLSFDFVTPELILAARVYGLGPAEAAQAARLAVAGPGHISAMAGAVDHTFVQAMAIEVDRRQQAITTAYPSGPNEISAAIAPLRAAAAGIAPTTQALEAAQVASRPAPSPAYQTSGFMAPPVASTSSFGIERRVPRGAFLWPSASVGALGLNAAAPDGEQSMSVAALELLAAHAVAELGTYAALSDHTYAVPAAAAQRASSEETSEPATARETVAAARAQALSSGATAALAGTAPSTEAGVAALYQRGESSESDVLAAAAALVPNARRARFDALYIALSQSPSGRTWSPAARAARAFALAGHGVSDDAQTLTAQERAATAWDVLPVVYATSVDTEARSSSSSAAGGSRGVARGARGTGPVVGGRASARGADAGGMDHVVDTRVDTRPGLANLSARAGEALGSYVSPQIVTQQASSSSSSTPGAVLRAPTAAQELVRTGRPAGRHGGGEVEIPAWFESAARKMLDDRSSMSDGISLAELTLIQSAPATHIAAAGKAQAHTAPAPAHATSDQSTPHKIDVHKLANEVYRHIMSMMDVARARNGEP